MHIDQKSSNTPSTQPIPHFSLAHDKERGDLLILSTGEEVELGHLHYKAISHVMLAIKTLNRLKYDPKMFSYERLKG